MAQLDAHPSGNLVVVGSTPAGSATFFCGALTLKYFSAFILSSQLIQEGQLSVSGQRMCTILVNRLEDKAGPVKVWLGKLTVLDMTPVGWLGYKTSTQTNILNVRNSRVLCRVCNAFIWALPCEKVSSGICGQWRPSSACASLQSDQVLQCLQTE